MAKQEPKMKWTIGDKTLIEFYKELIEKEPRKKHIGIKNRIEVLKRRIREDARLTTQN